MAQLQANERLLTGMTKMPQGWSAHKILIITALFCVLCTSLTQYLLTTKATTRLKIAIEQEIQAKITPKLANSKEHLLLAISAANKQQLGKIASEILQLDANYLMLNFYDFKGQLITSFKNDLVSQTMVKNISNIPNFGTMNQQKGQNLPTIVYQHINSMRLLEINSALKNTSESRINQGYVKIFVSVEQVYAKIESLQFTGSLLAIIIPIGCMLIFLLIINYTLISPIQRATLLINYVENHMEKVPEPHHKKTDALQTQILTHALHAGFTEISIRYKTTKLLEQTRRTLEDSQEESLLGDLRNIWTQNKLAEICQIFLTRVSNENKQYLVEEITPSSLNEMMSKSITDRLRKNRSQRHLDSKKELETEAILKFLQQGLEIDWLEHWVLSKANFQIMSVEHVIVLAIIPDEKSGLSPARFEELTLTWLREVVRIYQEIRYKNFAGEMELSREVQRKWIQSEGYADSDKQQTIDDLIACESIFSNHTMSDFIFTAKSPTSMSSTVIIGSVSSHGLRGALASTSIVAVLSDRWQIVKHHEPQRILKGLLTSINSYLWHVYKGQVVTNLIVLHFDHEKGIGNFAAYGNNFPLLLTPHERKPLIIAQAEVASPLGSMENFNFINTSFPVYPGQIIFGLTSSMAEITNSQGQKFEKAVLSGELAEIIDAHYQESAETILNHIFERSYLYSGIKIANVDLTGFVIKRQSPFV